MKVPDRLGASKRCTSRQARRCHGKRGLTAKSLRGPNGDFGFALVDLEARGGLLDHSAER
jgi:hypothetical protein